MSELKVAHCLLTPKKLSLRILTFATSFAECKITSYTPGPSPRKRKLWGKVFKSISNKTLNNLLFKDSRISQNIFRPTGEVSIAGYRVGVSNASMLSKGFSLNVPNIGYIGRIETDFPTFICNRAFITGVLSSKEQRAFMRYALLTSEIFAVGGTQADVDTALLALSYSIKKDLWTTYHKCAKETEKNFGEYVDRKPGKKVVEGLPEFATDEIGLCSLGQLSPSGNRLRPYDA